MVKSSNFQTYASLTSGERLKETSNCNSSNRKYNLKTIQKFTNRTVPFMVISKKNLSEIFLGHSANKNGGKISNLKVNQMIKEKFIGSFMSFYNSNEHKEEDSKKNVNDKKCKEKGENLIQSFHLTPDPGLDISPKFADDSKRIILEVMNEKERKNFNIISNNISLSGQKHLNNKG